MDVLTYVFSCLYFFLPAYFTNIAPPLGKKLRIFNFLDKRVDFGKKFLGKDIFGSHKTWRGVMLGMIFGFLIVLSQAFIYRFPLIQKISFLDYSRQNIFLLALLFPASAIFGDLFFAFIKRRLNLEPGAKFFPFDQINYVFGAALFLTPIFRIRLEVWLILLILTPFLHVATTQIGFKVGLSKSRW